MDLVDKVLGRTLRKQRAIEEYNLGLAAKYAGDWGASLAHNQRAAELNSRDEATWWNLAIAATAMKNWAEARRGWVACGITPDQEDGEVTTPASWACVRLVPDGVAEVVWGERIDPARIRVRNVPLPESDRLYDDIILNDGAEEGTRTSRGEKFPVFNELAVWRRSEYSTYGVALRGTDGESLASLERLCERHGMHSENWGTMRMLCAVCSKGNPGEHVCSEKMEGDECSFGFASRSRTALAELLAEWSEVNEGVQAGEPELLVAGVSL